MPCLQWPTTPSGQKGHLGEKDGSLDTTSDKDLRSCRGRKLVLAVYAQECET